MTKKIGEYLKYYLGCECSVKCKEVGNEWLTGKIVEVTEGSNHGNWVEVLFAHVIRLHRSIYSRGYSESNMHHFFMGEDEIKPILRKLSDMTEEEALTVSDMTEEEALTVFDKGYSKGNLFLRPDEFHCLLSRGFDLFGLIEAGLAIDKSTVK